MADDLKQTGRQDDELAYCQGFAMQMGDWKQVAPHRGELSNERDLK